MTGGGVGGVSSETWETWESSDHSLHVDCEDWKERRSGNRLSECYMCYCSKQIRLTIASHVFGYAN